VRREGARLTWLIKKFLPTFLDPALDPFALYAGRVDLDVVVPFSKLAEQEKWLREK